MVCDLNRSIKIRYDRRNYWYSNSELGLIIWYRKDIVKAKEIILVHPKFRMILLLSNRTFFQIAIAILYFCLLLLVKVSLFGSFLVSGLCFYCWLLSIKLSLFQLSLFLALRCVSKKISVTFCFHLLKYVQKVKQRDKEQ